MRPPEGGGVREEQELKSQAQRRSVRVSFGWERTLWGSEGHEAAKGERTWDAQKEDGARRRGGRRNVEARGFMGVGGKHKRNRAYSEELGGGEWRGGTSGEENAVVGAKLGAEG